MSFVSTYCMFLRLGRQHCCIPVTNNIDSPDAPDGCNLDHKLHQSTVRESLCCPRVDLASLVASFRRS